MVSRNKSLLMVLPLSSTASRFISIPFMGKTLVQSHPIRVVVLFFLSYIHICVFIYLVIYVFSHLFICSYTLIYIYIYIYISFNHRWIQNDSAPVEIMSNGFQEMPLRSAFSLSRHCILIPENPLVVHNIAGMGVALQESNMAVGNPLKMMVSRGT